MVRRRRDPLRRRLWRELRGEAGKYIVIFLLMTLSIGFISGYLVADGSMITAYNEGFEKYNVEDGHFETRREMNRAQRKAVSALGIEIYDLYYTEKELTNGTKLRIYAERDAVDLTCLMAGAMPAADGEIAIDRMYADNNGLSVGDTVESGGETYTVTGLVALPDYSCLFESNADTMFDAVKFGVAVVSAQAFEAFRELHYVYAWKYDEPPAGEQQEHDRAEELLESLSDEVHLSDYVPRYLNQAITFTGEDMSSDRAMMITLLYVVIAILAFVFAVTVSNTIVREAAVIGTLRASGYTRGELVRHYMSMPLLVTVVSAALGNIMGYTFFKYLCAGMYYGSYSLPTYVTIWNGEAFLLTTAVPLALMAVITWMILRRRLALSPLQFLRCELTRGGQRRAVRLWKRIPFFSRFRLRVILQNIPNYLILLVGILFANLLLMFGLVLPDVLHAYQADIADNMLSRYQYMLTLPLDAVNEERKLESAITMMAFYRAVETENPDAEKFSAYTLKTTDEAYKIEDVILYGVEPDSRYIDADLSGGAVYVTSAFADKNELSPGDVITLREPYGTDTYELTVTGVYDYDAGLAVFMERGALNLLMGEDADAFGGYFSDSEITDIDGDYIGSVVTIDDLTKISRQLDVSMGQMMYLVDGFSVVMFMVLMYLLSKIIIEKNAQSISMAKILGYTNGEIGRLYVLSTSIVTVALLAASLPVERAVMAYLFRYFMMEMTGWIRFSVSAAVYEKMFALGVLSYAAVAVLELRRVRRVPMDEALKNAE